MTMMTMGMMNLSINDLRLIIFKVLLCKLDSLY